MAKPTLQLQIGQHLSLTPQLQQAIKLLTLSTLELTNEIQQALESNPLLEHPEYVELPATNGEDRESESPAESAADKEQNTPEEYAEPATMDDSYLTQPSRAPAPSGSTDRIPEGDSRSQEGLREYLLWQLHLTPMSPRDHAIAALLIDSVDDSGYLTDDSEAIQAALAPEVHADADEIEAVLHRVQRFDPIGVASRNLSECLLVQLSALPEETPGFETAKAIAEDHLDALANGDLDKIRKALKLAPGELSQAVALIRSLDPRPGSSISTANTEYVLPDVYVAHRNGAWQVSLNPQALPRLCINNYYADMIGGAGRDDASYLRGQLQEARWFLKSIQTRNDTLLSVARAIVAAQSEFFEHGEEAMKPMVLRDIAEAVELHESTVSRVTTRKYMHTPRGVFEFKYFFSSHVGTSDGGEASSTAIRSMIRSLVDQEPAGKPLSDSKITRLLGERGIDVARRTVAKYRESLGIPSSTERRRQAKSAFQKDVKRGNGQ